MRTRSSLFSRLLLSVGISLALICGAAAQGVPLEKATKDAVIEQVGKLVLNNCFVPGVDFSKWPEFLDQNKAAIDKASTDSELVEAINSKLSGYFGVSHIVLVTPKAAKARIERKTVGIGVQVQLEEGGLRVMNVFPDTPASEAGLQIGDLIMEADGKKLTATTGMMGDEGTKVEIRVKGGDGKVKAYKLVRRKYSNIREDTLKMANPTTAVMTVHTFDTAYNANTIDQLFEKAKDVPNLIVDLRGNGGGVVLNMLDFLGHVLPSGSGFGTFVDRSAVRRYGEAFPSKPAEIKEIAAWMKRPLMPRRGKTTYKGNIAVLVNGGTGSAAEITAQALKELKGAPVLGTKSAGAVLVSVMAQLPEGWVLQYPMMDYVSVQGVRLEANGVEVDIEAPTPKLNEPDLAVEKATALLRRIELRKERSGDGKILVL